MSRTIAEFRSQAVRLHGALVALRKAQDEVDVEAKALHAMADEHGVAFPDFPRLALSVRNETICTASYACSEELDEKAGAHFGSEFYIETAVSEAQALVDLIDLASRDAEAVPA